MKVFLSHAGADLDAAMQLADLLGKHGHDVWVDGTKIDHCSNWLAQIEQGIEQADAFLVYVTHHGVTPWVDAEVRAALVLNRQRPAFRMIPLLGPGHDKDKLPLFLRSETSWVELPDNPSEQVARILAALHRGGDARQPVTVLAPDESPYLGLRAFKDQHAHKFFGRDQDVVQLLDGMRKDSLLTLIGSSGSGKSSLLRAGLVPALRRGRFHDGRGFVTDWRIAVFQPGDDPLAAVSRELVTLGPPLEGKERLDAIDAVRERISRDDPDALPRTVLDLVQKEDARVLLIADQFEELLRSRAREDDCRRLVEGLLRATESPDRIHVLLHLRADFLHGCERYPELARRIARNLHWCLRMQGEQLRDAIESPLLLAGWSAGHLVDTLLRDVRDEPGDLALLAFALDHLWRHRNAVDGPERPAGTPTLPFEVYERMGGIEGALERRAEEIYGQVTQGDEASARLVRAIFLELAQRSAPGAPITRRRVLRRELLERFPPPERARAEDLLNDLVDERLLVADLSDQSAPETTTVDVAHEVLLRRWPRIAQWLDEDHERRQAEETLRRAAAEWQRAEGGPHAADYLWKGSRVETELAAARLDVVPPGVLAFADACRSEDERQAARDRALRGQVDMLARLHDIEPARREADELYPPLPTVVPKLERWLMERAAPIEGARPQLERQLEALAAGDAESDAFLRDSLRAGLAKLSAFDQVVASVRERLEWAQRVEELSVVKYRHRWDAARAAIQRADGHIASELYRAHPLDLRPQVGLVPIGMNPETKLWEFYDLRSAADPLAPPPAHREDGRIEVLPETGIVLVLIPGGTFAMGAQREDPRAANCDPDAEPDERPVHSVTLSPFFLARHAMTQAQWARLSGGERPSRFPGDTHPVEQVDWDQCTELLRRAGLALPTEAQWEYAARAGTSTPWWTGKTKTPLRRAANLADQSYKRAGGTAEIEDWDDGFAAHGPVDALLANPFGLHHVHGNVWEWCGDAYGQYDSPCRQGDGLRHTEGPASIRVVRGGSFNFPARHARSSFRDHDAPGLRGVDLGLRPAKEIATS